MPSWTVVALMLAMAVPGQAHALDARQVFQRLSSLTGDWQGQYSDGRSHRVNYRLSAGGSVLVETWALALGRESLTLYYLDGDRLLASHYCPQGNQPRLRLGKADDSGFHFAFLDGTNLQVEGKSHQHALWLSVDSAERFRRSETYVENGVAAGSEATASPVEGDAVVTYHRVVDAAAAH